MMSDGAARRGTSHAVSGHMPGETADDGTLEAASRLSLSQTEHGRESEGGSDGDAAHGLAPRN